MSLWHIADPLRHDSLFCVLKATYAQMDSPLPERGVDGIPKDLAVVCHLDSLSTAEKNPYFNAAHAVSQLMCLPDSQVTIGHTEIFTRTIHGAFRCLLQAKDPVALLLLYLWYSKAGRGVWWIEARARVECPAICKYLRLYHEDDQAIHALIPEGSLAGS